MWITRCAGRAAPVRCLPRKKVPTRKRWRCWTLHWRTGAHWGAQLAQATGRQVAELPGAGAAGGMGAAALAVFAAIDVPLQRKLLFRIQATQWINHPACLREQRQIGLAGIGKIPIDIVFGSTKADASVSGTIKDFEGKLGGLQKELEDTGSKGGVGFVSKLLFGGRSREDVQRDIDVTKNQLDALKKFGDKIEPKKSESGEQKPKIEFKSAPEPKPKTGGGGGGSRSQIDDAERMLATMRERITLNEQDLQSVDKMTAVEKESAKVKFQLETGTLKATEAQKQAILANFEQLAAQEKALKAQEEYRRGVEQLEHQPLRIVGHRSSLPCDQGTCPRPHPGGTTGPVASASRSDTGFVSARSAATVGSDSRTS